MGANGSRLCLFSVETSDAARFPQLREIRGSPVSQSSCVEDQWLPLELLRKILVTLSIPAAIVRYSRDGVPSSSETDDVTSPWIQRDESTKVDIDAPPQQMPEGNFDTCLPFRCLTPVLTSRFESRLEAIRAAQQAIMEGNRNLALKAYEAALTLAVNDDRPQVVLPGFPRNPPVPKARQSIHVTAPSHVPVLTLRHQEDAELFDKCAGLCFESGDSERASLYLEHATWLDKTNVDYWYRRGVIYQQRSIWGAAHDCFTRCLDLSPDYVPALFHLAVFLCKNRRHEEAVGRFQSLLSADPHHTEAMVLLAVCYEKLGRLDEALSTIEKVLMIDPEYIAASELRDALKEKLENPRSASGSEGSAIPRETKSYESKEGFCQLFETRNAYRQLEMSSIVQSRS